MKKSTFYIIAVLLAFVGILIFVHPGTIGSAWKGLYFIIPAIIYFFVGMRIEDKKDWMVSEAITFQIASFLFVIPLAALATTKFVVEELNFLAFWMLYPYLILTGISLLFLAASELTQLLSKKPTKRRK